MIEHECVEAAAAFEDAAILTCLEGQSRINVAGKGCVARGSISITTKNPRDGVGNLAIAEDFVFGSH